MDGIQEEEVFNSLTAIAEAYSNSEEDSDQWSDTENGKTSMAGLANPGVIEQPRFQSVPNHEELDRTPKEIDLEIQLKTDVKSTQVDAAGARGGQEGNSSNFTSTIPVKRKPDLDNNNDSCEKPHQDAVYIMSMLGEELKDLEASADVTGEGSVQRVPPGHEAECQPALCDESDSSDDESSSSSDSCPWVLMHRPGHFRNYADVIGLSRAYQGDCKMRGAKTTVSPGGGVILWDKAPWSDFYPGRKYSPDISIAVHDSTMLQILPPNSVILKQSLEFPHYPGANYPFHPLVFPNLFGPRVNPMTCALEVALKKSYANFLFRNGQNEPMGMHPQTSHGQSNYQALMTVFFETTLFAYWKTAVVHICSPSDFGSPSQRHLGCCKKSCGAGRSWWRKSQQQSTPNKGWTFAQGNDVYPLVYHDKYESSTASTSVAYTVRHVTCYFCWSTTAVVWGLSDL